MQSDVDPVGSEIAEFIMSSRRLPKLDWAENILERRLVSSLFVLQLIAFLERRFELNIQDADLDAKNFASVNSVRSLVMRKRADLVRCAKA